MAHLGIGSHFCRLETSRSMYLVEYSGMGRPYHTRGYRRSHREILWKRNRWLMQILGIRSCTGHHQHHSSGQSVWATCSVSGSSRSLSNDHVDGDQRNAPDRWDTACSTFCLPPGSSNATGWTHETAARSNNLPAHGVFLHRLGRFILSLLLPVYANRGAVE